MSVSYPQPEARELTEKELAELTEAAFDVEKRIKTAFAIGREQLWEAAKALYEFDEMKGWKLLNYDKISDWLASPDVTLTYTTYRRMVQTYRDLAVHRNVALPTLVSLDLSKAHIALPALKAGKITVDEFVDDVEALGAQDLREKYIPSRQAEPEPEPDDDPDFEADMEDDEDHVGAATDEEPEALADDDVLEETATWDQVVEEFSNALESGQAEPRIPVKFLRGALKAINDDKLIVRAFQLKYQSGPRSRHMADWVEELSQVTDR